MRIDNGEFYILDLGKEMEVCPTLADAVDLLRASRSEDAEIQKFSQDGARWKIGAVSWKEVSMLLLEGVMGDQTKS